jgi:hypothetical protein
MEMLRGDMAAPSINSSKETDLADFWRFVVTELVMA